MKLMTKERHASFARVVGQALGLVGSIACGGGHTIDNGPIEGRAGSPSLNLGGQTGATTTTAVYPNPCEIDLAFGSVPVGLNDSVIVRIENVGAGALEVSPVNPTLDPAFTLNDGEQAPIQPGSFSSFSVTLSPVEPGPVESTFTIQTNGFNLQCPIPVGASDSILTAELMGTGVAT
jgi:hypothetical protein